MSTKKNGRLAKSPERHKRLRRFLRRLFWSRERSKEKRDIEDKMD